MVIDASRLIRRFAGCALGLALAWAAPMTAAADRPPPTDPQLADLLSEAVANNPELAAARSERDAAQQRIAPAGALEDPMLELGVINAPLDPLSLESRRHDHEDARPQPEAAVSRQAGPAPRGRDGRRGQHGPRSAGSHATGSCATCASRTRNSPSTRNRSASWRGHGRRSSNSWQSRVRATTWGRPRRTTYSTRRPSSSDCALSSCG